MAKKSKGLFDVLAVNIDKHPMPVSRAGDRQTRPAGQGMHLSSNDRRPAQRPAGTAEQAPDSVKQLFREAFDFYKRHRPAGTPGSVDDATWTAILDDLAATADRCGNTPFALDMLRVIFEQLEREWTPAGEDAQHDEE